VDGTHALSSTDEQRRVHLEFDTEIAGSVALPAETGRVTIGRAPVRLIGADSQLGSESGELPLPQITKSLLTETVKVRVVRSTLSSGEAGPPERGRKAAWRGWNSDAVGPGRDHRKRSEKTSIQFA